MSVTFSIIPIDEQFDEEDSIKWLQNHSLVLSTGYRKGHRPSIHEIQTVLEGIPDLDIESHITESTWHVNIRKNQFHLEFDSPFSGDTSDTYLTGMRGSFDLMVEIVTELVKVCGTLIILVNGEDPMLFEAKTGL